MSDTLDRIGEAILNGGKAVGDKISGAVDVAKLNFEIKRNEEILEQKFIDLGKKYYEAHKDEDPAQFTAIDAAKRQIAALKKQISQAKGEKICEKCGAVNPLDAAFCNKCAEPFPKN